MDEVTTEGTSQASVAPDFFHLSGSTTDPKPIHSFDFCDSSEANQSDNANENCHDLHVSNADENCHDKLEGKGTSPDNSADELQAESNSYKASDIAERFIQVMDNRVLVDTAAPIESVKDAVSKFGGILDWKERRKHVQLELDKVQEDVPEYQRRAEAAEVEKNRVLQDLGSNRRMVEELKLSLEKAQTEEAQAQQDAELAEMRFKETQQGIAHRESTAAKAELELARDRVTTAVADLQSVKEELEHVQKEHASLAAERDVAVATARESAAASQETEKAVEDLTLELISLKELLASSHAAHMEAEERRMNIAVAFQQEKVDWQNELKQADEEVQKLNDEMSFAKGLEAKLDAASALLVNLRAELFAYMEATLSQEAGEAEAPTVSVRMRLEKTKKELEDVKANIETAVEEVKRLRVAAASMRTDLEKETAGLAALKQKEGLASISVLSLEEELSKIASELAAVHERAMAIDMPVELRQATQEAQQAKTTARLAREEVATAREEAERAKAEANAMQMRLEAVLRETLAANTSEEVAKASANALQDATALQECKKEDEERKGDDQSDGVTLPVEERNELSKRARETEDLANKRVIRAVEMIKEAKEAEVRSLDKLEQLTKLMEERKATLKAAQEKAVAAQDGKLAVENELRKWRAEHEEQRRKVGEGALGLAEISTLGEESSSGEGGARGTNPHILSPRGYMRRPDTVLTTSTPTESKSRKSFFPRIVMFLARKKAQSLK